MQVQQHSTTKYSIPYTRASTVQAGVVDYVDWFGPNSNGVGGCTGKLIVEPPFKRGDIE